MGQEDLMNTAEDVADQVTFFFFFFYSTAVVSVSRC